MRIVLAKHDSDPKEYVFSVPDYMMVHKGDLLLVSTKRGTDIATAMTDTIEGAGVGDIAERFGAYRPIKSVQEVCGQKLRDYIRKQTLNRVVKIVKDERDESYIPF